MNLTPSCRTCKHAPKKNAASPRICATCRTVPTGYPMNYVAVDDLVICPFNEDFLSLIERIYNRKDIWVQV